jgi:hypothetical protein
MTTFRFLPIPGLCAVALPMVIAASLTVSSAAAADDLRQHCRQVRDDDAIRKYDPRLRDDALHAYRLLFPDARSAPSDSEFETQSSFRCMDGKVMVCFSGANLVCGKMNADRKNAGADTFCRSTPNADFVPLAATGHDTIYSYRCRNGEAVVSGTTWALDKRGFATRLWAAAPDR